MSKLQKVWKCQVQGESEFDITNDEKHVEKAYPLDGEVEEGWFITKEQLTELLWDDRIPKTKSLHSHRCLVTDILKELIDNE